YVIIYFSSSSLIFRQKHEELTTRFMLSDFRFQISDCPSTIRISVPNLNDGQVIEITVQSLSENVADLKEKIANKMELSGKPRVLKDNKSLAHYNLGAGDILTLSL
ncbi:Ubiquitin domain, partial [Arabidopsis suecica]